MIDTKPDGLLNQYKLLRSVIDAPWATRLDHKVISHVIDRYMKKYGQSRASLRYLETATGANRTRIVDSIRRLVTNGAISVLRAGEGTRPTEYGLKFDFATKVNSGDGLDTPNSGDGLETSCGDGSVTSTVPSGDGSVTESCLRNRLTSRLTESSTNTPAVPTAPPLGLTPTEADPAVDPKKEASPFEELWSAYPLKQDRAKAKAAYNSLGPDDALHRTLVERAIALAGHYRAENTEKKWQKRLHKWLEEERYLEDLPTAYEHPRDANRTKAARKASRSQKPSKAATGTHTAEVMTCDIEGEDPSGFQELVVGLRTINDTTTGEVVEDRIVLSSNNENQLFEGQQRFHLLMKACGKGDDIRDVNELVGCRTKLAMQNGGVIEYLI